MGTITPVRRSSMLGLVAIIFWSTTIAFSRSLTEQLGTFTAAALIYSLAGIFGLIYTGLHPQGFKAYREFPKAYLLGCGLLFVIYITALYLAVGFAANRVQVLTIGLINYLWPGLSLIFSIPILGRRARASLPLGLIIALIGIWLSTTNGSGLTVANLLEGRGAMLPYGLALAAAVSWGLYSNLSRRWGGENDGGAVPLFLLASGLLLGLLRLLNPETTHWSVTAGFELMYMALFPGMLAYVLWDLAVRKGEIILVASLSYLTPLLSTLISSLVLNVQPGPALWLGAGLVMVGAVLCKVSILEPQEEGSSA